MDMNDGWEFQSEGRKTNDVPTAASPKRKSRPPFRRTFTYAVWCQQTPDLVKLSLEQDHLVSTSCYDKLRPVLCSEVPYECAQTLGKVGGECIKLFLRSEEVSLLFHVRRAGLAQIRAVYTCATAM